MKANRTSDVLIWLLIAGFGVGIIANFDAPPHTLDTSISYLAR